MGRLPSFAHKKVCVIVLTRVGTGKTLLAVDFAFKSSTQGKRVLYLTYNKNLSNSIREQQGEQDWSKIINIHALFGEYVTVDLVKMEENAQKYFTDILPEEFYEYICNLEDAAQKQKGLQYDFTVTGYYKAELFSSP